MRGNNSENEKCKRLRGNCESRKLDNIGSFSNKETKVCISTKVDEGTWVDTYVPTNSLNPKIHQKKKKEKLHDVKGIFWQKGRLTKIIRRLTKIMSKHLLTFSINTKKESKSGRK